MFRTAVLRFRVHGIKVLGAGVVLSAALVPTQCAESSKKVLSWGSNQFGQLGIGSEANQFVPSEVATSGDILQIAAGEANAAMLTSEGDVFTWGRGQNNALGHGNDSNCNTPKLVEIEGKVTALGCSGTHCAVVTQDGKVFSWGSNALGRTGSGSQPGRIVGLDSADIKQVACGRSHSLAVSSKGELFVWGRGYEGALGTGRQEDCPEPVRVESVVDTRWQQVAAGNGFSVLLSEQGQVYTCGNGEFGQTAQGASSDRYLRIPTPVRALGSKKVIHVAAGTFHAACCTAEGEVYTWGLGSDGQIGNGSSSLHNTTPQHVQGALQGQKVCEVSCGTAHTAARTQDGKLFIWGRGRDGQLGQMGVSSPAARREKPVEVGITGVLQVSLGGDFSLARVR